MYLNCTYELNNFLVHFQDLVNGEKWKLIQSEMKKRSQFYQPPTYNDDCSKKAGKTIKSYKTFSWVVQRSSFLVELPYSWLVKIRFRKQIEIQHPDRPDRLDRQTSDPEPISILHNCHRLKLSSMQIPILAKNVVG